MEKMDSYSPKIVEAFKAIASYAVKGAKGMPPAWPINIAHAMWVQSRFLPREVYRLMKELEKIGIDKKAQSKIFFGPSVLSQWLFFAQWGRSSGVSKYPFYDMVPEESVDFIERVIDLIKLQRREDPFCAYGKNILLSNEEVKKLISQSKFIGRESLEIGKIISKIHFALMHYCNLIQVAFRAYSQEFHGPYHLKNGTILLVRDYFNLKPIEVWRLVSKFPYEKMRFLEIYKDIEIKMGLTGVYWTSVPPFQCLKKVAVFVDDKKVTNIEDIQRILENSLDILEKGNREVIEFTTEDWIRKLVEMRYLWLKPAKEKLGENWKPTEDIYKLAEEGLADCEKIDVKIWRDIVTSLSEDEAIEKITQILLDNTYRGERT